jgi:hypothetical protein
MDDGDAAAPEIEELMLQLHLYFRPMLTLDTLFRTEEHNNVRTGGTTIRRLSTPLGRVLLLTHPPPGYAAWIFASSHSFGTD